MINCADCGRFCRPAAWKMVYSGYPPTPDRELYKCEKCLSTNGAFEPDYRIRPEASCGLIKAVQS
jgi:hypothetical protein